MNDHTRILAAALLAAEHSISITHHTDTVTVEALRAGTLWWSTAPVHTNRAIATASAIADLCDQLSISSAAATTTALLALRGETVL